MTTEPQHQKKTQVLGVAVTPADRKRIDAARGREPLSSWIYRLIQNQFIREDVRRRPITQSRRLERRRALRKIATAIAKTETKS